MTFTDIAYDCAVRTRVSLATKRIGWEEVQARAEKLAAFLPEEERPSWKESWVGVATGVH